MKYLKRFNTDVEYQNFKNTSDYILPNVSYVVETTEVHYNPHLMDKSQNKPGDVAYWDVSSSSVKIIAVEKWENTLGTPVGVVVIPEGILPDGNARIAALNQEMTTWGSTGASVFDTNYTVIPTFENTNEPSVGVDTTGFLPSEFFYGPECIMDPVAKYYNMPCVPSPYNSIGTELRINEDCIKSLDGNNALSDFYGYNNTMTLATLGNYPAANYCWGYTDGLSNLQWYLPSMGELAFVMVRCETINTTIELLGGNNFVAGNPYISSTEYSSDKIYALQIEYGSVHTTNKNYNRVARPFAVLTK